MTGFWYLASPYTKHPRGMDAACAEVCATAAICFRAGLLVFSPIAHTHAIAVAGDLPGHFDQWADFDKVMIRASNGMIVVKMDGYDASAGIAAEIALCRGMGKPVVYMQPDGPIPALSLFFATATTPDDPGDTSNTEAAQAITPHPKCFHCGYTRTSVCDRWDCPELVR